MSAEDVCMLLARDTIQVTSEEDVLESLLRWYRWDKTSRKNQLPALMENCVRAGLLAMPFYNRLKQDPSNQDILEMVKTVLEKNQHQNQNSLRGMQQVLVVCGGEGLVME